MVPANLSYDPDADQLVVTVAAADGAGDVELLRADVAGLDAGALDRLRHVRDPQRPVPAPGVGVVTRRELA